jgi:hypothetical protein
MSIAGYLSAGKPKLRQAELRMAGEKTVEVAEDPVWPGDDYYERVEDYDPVLRAHCRLAQRE